MICSISENPMRFVFSHYVLGKYEVSYFFCDTCGLLSVEKPYWLNEAYQQAIGDTDTGLVSRNINNSNFLELLLHRFDFTDHKLLDVAGGYGLLARMLRDKGFDCYTTDKYCENLFAKSFEPMGEFDPSILFAFEVLEHLDSPHKFLVDLFKQYKCRTILFSTLTFSGEIPTKDWWYYSFDSGQHISFYQTRTLETLANRLGCQYVKITDGLHLFTDRTITKIDRLLLTNRFVRKLYSYYVRFKRKGISKTSEDYLKMKTLLANSD